MYEFRFWARSDAQIWQWLYECYESTNPRAHLLEYPWPCHWLDAKEHGNKASTALDYRPTQRPPVPYGKQEASTSLVSEQSFNQVRGPLTEGRYLAFEMNGYALSAGNGLQAADGQYLVIDKNEKAMRVRYLGNTRFCIFSVTDSDQPAFAAAARSV